MVNEYERTVVNVNGQLRISCVMRPLHKVGVRSVSGESLGWLKRN